MPIAPTRTVALLLGLAPASALAPATAFAHAILISSTPAVNGTVPPGHLDIVLHYNSRIDAPRSRVTIAGPDRTGLADAHRLPIEGRGDAFVAATDVKPGAWLIRWQALALDGHITRGEVPFTVAPPKG